MITEKDLQAAIAECKGQRNPGANTCIKLAACYILQDHLFPKEEPILSSYSHDATPLIQIDSKSEFADLVNGRTVEEILPIIDEAMEAIKVLHPAFYASILRKIEY